MAGRFRHPSIGRLGLCFRWPNVGPADGLASFDNNASFVTELQVMF
jgi:hypothetical protein